MLQVTCMNVHVHWHWCTGCAEMSGAGDEGGALSGLRFWKQTLGGNDCIDAHTPSWMYAHTHTCTPWEKKGPGSNVIMPGLAVRSYRGRRLLLGKKGTAPDQIYYQHPLKHFQTRRKYKGTFRTCQRKHYITSGLKMIVLPTCLQGAHLLILHPNKQLLHGTSEVKFRSYDWRWPAPWASKTVTDFKRMGKNLIFTATGCNLPMITVNLNDII